jgi:uncharacterized protein
MTATRIIAALMTTLLWGLSSPATALDAPADSVSGTPLVVPDATVRTLQASGSGRRFEIIVARPATPPPADGYPVLYVLDGNIMSLTAIEAARANQRRLDRLPGDDLLVVAIGYPDGIPAAEARIYDMTPPGITDPRVAHPTGGADAFLDFIEHDLQPALARELPIDPRRQALFGHSLAGQFTLYTLLTRPQLFDTYLAASPSVWLGEGYLMDRLPDAANAWSPGQPPRRLLLTVGEFEETLHPALEGHPRAQEFARRFADMRQNSRMHEVADRLSHIPGLLFQFHQVSGEDHGSVIPAAIGRAVFFAMIGPKAPPVPSARDYQAMTPEQRYALRLWIRDLPDAQRIPWLTTLRDNLHRDLSEAEVEVLHAERNRMDADRGTRPHAVNAPGDH